MAKIEDLMEQAGGDWGGIEQITPTVRFGFANEFVIVERTLPNDTSGVYALPYIPVEQMESFLAWRASLSKK